jgi:hypothetical protein
MGLARTDQLDISVGMAGVRIRVRAICESALNGIYERKEEEGRSGYISVRINFQRKNDSTKMMIAGGLVEFAEAIFSIEDCLDVWTRISERYLRVCDSDAANERWE